MRTAWQTFPVELTGGLVTKASPLQQGIDFPGSASILINYEPSIEGGYKKILGYKKWSEFPVPGVGQVTAAILTSPSSCITVRDGIFYTSQGQADWVLRLNKSTDVGGKIRYTSFNFDGTEKVVMVDSLNKPFIWSSADQSIVELSSAPSDVQGATRVAEFKGHIFFAKGSNLFFTAPFDETDFDSGNGAGVINVGSAITGLIVFREQLIIFSLDRINRIAGNTSTDFVMQPITNKTGSIEGDTVQEVGGDILYLGPDGVRFLSATEKIGDFALERASENIQKEITDTFDGLNIYSSTVIRRKNQYRIFRYDSYVANTSQVSYLATRFLDRQSSGIEWATLKGFKVYTADSQQFDSSEVILFASDTDYLYLMEDGFSFDGSEIPCTYRSPFWPVQDPKLRKTFYKQTLYLKLASDNTLTSRVLLDYDQPNIIQPSSFTIEPNSDIVPFWGEAVWGDFTWEEVIPNVYPNQVIGSGFTVAVEYTESSTKAPFALDTIILEYRLNDRK